MAAGASTGGGTDTAGCAGAGLDADGALKGAAAGGDGFATEADGLATGGDCLATGGAGGRVTGADGLVTDGEGVCGGDTLADGGATPTDRSELSAGLFADATAGSDGSRGVARVAGVGASTDVAAVFDVAEASAATLGRGADGIILTEDGFGGCGGGVVEAGRGAK